MTVKPPTYRYDHNASGGTRGHPHELIEDGVLVPDGRLQAIADAWEAYKEQPMSEGLAAFAAAFDDVADLLDALTHEGRR